MTGTARGAQTSILTLGMFGASLLDQIVNIERCSEACVEFAQSNVDFRAQARQNLDPIEQFTRDLLARSLRQGGGFRKSEVECVTHGRKPITMRRAKKGKPRAWKQQLFDWDNALVIEDTSETYGEQRFRALGFIGADLHMMAFTMRGETIRVISLRKATRAEWKRWSRE
jgi:uncharacterized DUF497 family protein